MKWLLAALIASVIIAGTAAGAVWALADVSRSFTAADNGIVAGSLVSTKSGTSDTVVLASTNNGQQLIGVVVPTDRSLLAIDSTTNKAQVAISGTADTLVSTINGDIKAGDQIAVSPISGVGMEASGSLRTIGIAQADFSSKTSGAQSRQVADKAGHNQQIYIGTIPVAISIGYSSTATSTQSGLLSGLQTFAVAVAGHQVTVLQTIFSFLIVIIAIGALIGLVYGAIHGSIVSIGRNPLARESIYKSLVQVIIMAAMIALTTIVLLYLTLR